MSEQDILVFFAMGGFGAYVWSAYGVVVVVMVWIVVSSYMRKRNVLNVSRQDAKTPRKIILLD